VAGLALACKADGVVLGGSADFNGNQRRPALSYACRGGNLAALVKKI
jgi:hypothetical protein